MQIVPIPVQIGDSVLGILDRFDPVLNGRYITAYRFVGRANQPVQVLLVGSRDDRGKDNLSMQPYLVLYDSANRVLARTGAAPRSIAAFARLRLPQDGEYTVVIAGVEPQKPGRYRFAVQNIEPRLAETLVGIEISETTGSVPASQQRPDKRSPQSARP
ncbi:hypothetical protein ACQ4M3_20630 [Leptolyngbya sp. AN03gr2]